ncbi:hypothetical protein LGN13_07115 [Burkholderia multivorans]|uniref:hypothetical protein n=1 Tax=Burkholderia multivorans TaxID=87883 RepID=UPI00111F6759|nr:hypothetical protein [Burkholderia multivorans]MCA8501465.1 hypothetical protein [Burkholderia multivorans]MDN8080772.1 hypothetical protein [Burkholderia multivorans]
MVIVYLGIKFLPMAIEWGAVHWNIAPLSPKQAENHEAILTIFGWAFVLQYPLRLLGGWLWHSGDSDRNRIQMLSSIKI